MAAKGTCSVDGCTKPSKTRGWCTMHYNRVLAHGVPGEAAPRRRKSTGRCVVDGCLNEPAGVACTMHQQRHRKTGAYGPVERMAGKAKGTTCEAPGCQKPTLAKGRCTTHYQRWEKYGSFELPEKAPLPTCAAEGCDKKVRKHDMCLLHRTRFAKTGQTGPRILKRDLGVEFLLGLTEPTEACVAWPFTRDDKGYGKLDVMGERFAHRVCARLFIGEQPEGLPLVLHSCGKGHEGCVAPWHLYWGDYSMNHRDSVRHGTAAVGSRHWYAKLTEADIPVIRRDPRGEYEIALDYGVTAGAIYMVRNYHSWKHVA